MSTAETAACLDLTEETVKIRLLRARKMLKQELYARAGATSAQAFNSWERVVTGLFRPFSPNLKAPREGNLEGRMSGTKAVALTLLLIITIVLVIAYGFLASEGLSARKKPSDFEYSIANRALGISIPS
jgi:hypothetical protein